MAGRFSYTLADYTGRTTTLSLDVESPVLDGSDYPAWRGKMTALKTAFDALVTGTEKANQWAAFMNQIPNAVSSDTGCIARQQWVLVLKDQSTNALYEYAIGTADTDEFASSELIVTNGVIHLRADSAAFIALATAINGFVLHDGHEVGLHDVYYRTR